MTERKRICIMTVLSAVLVITVVFALNYFAIGHKQEKTITAGIQVPAIPTIL